jgi:O-antigen/teichoic acid export membrane protein
MYGKSFLPTLLPLKILALQQTMWMISKVFQAFFAGTRKPLLPSIIVAIANVFSLLSMLIKVPSHGIVGAAIAVSLGQAVYLGMNFFQAKRLG